MAKSEGTGGSVCCVGRARRGAWQPSAGPVRGSDQSRAGRSRKGVWKGAWLGIFVVIVAATSIACASIEGTRDRSRTLVRLSAPDGRQGIAILKLPEVAAIDGLADRIERDLLDSLAAEMAGTRVVASREVGQALLARKGYLQHFARWRSTYQYTGVLDAKPLPHYGRAVGARYLLLVTGIDVDREKISVAEADCPGICWVNPDRLWRTVLRISAELIDTSVGGVVWRGVGESQYIQNGPTDLDFGIVRVHRAKGEVESIASQLIAAATDGLAQELADGSHQAASP